MSICAIKVRLAVLVLELVLILMSRPVEAVVGGLRSTLVLLEGGRLNAGTEKPSERRYVVRQPVTKYILFARWKECHYASVGYAARNEDGPVTIAFWSQASGAGLLA